jgi:hypothetical protein
VASPTPREAANDLVDAVFDVTPQLDGEIIVGTTRYVTEYAEGEERDPFVPDEYDCPVFGEPSPVIARQTATALRWLIANDGWQAGHASVWDALAALAVELEHPSRAEADRG